MKAQKAVAIAERVVASWETVEERAATLILEVGLTPAHRPFIERRMRDMLGGELAYETALEILGRASGCSWEPVLEKDPISA